MNTGEELSIRIKADKENNMLHITDTGIGMSKEDMISQLGTIAKSGTSEFLQKMQVRYDKSVSRVYFVAAEYTPYSYCFHDKILLKLYSNYGFCIVKEGLNCARIQQRLLQ